MFYSLKVIRGPGLGKHEFILLYYLPRSITCIEHPPSLQTLPLLPKGVGHREFGGRQFCPPQEVTLYCFKSCSFDFLLLFFFNWRKIALRCFVGFCRTAMWISYKYTHIPTLLSLPPPGPSCPSRSSQSARLGSVCYTAASHQFSALHVGVHLCWCYFLHLSWPLLLKFLSLFYLPLDRGVYWRWGSEEQ